MTEHEAWEMVRESYLFPPEEVALKEKADREPVTSVAARLFNEIVDLEDDPTGPKDPHDLERAILELAEARERLKCKATIAALVLGDEVFRRAFLRQTALKKLPIR